MGYIPQPPNFDRIEKAARAKYIRKTAAKLLTAMLSLKENANTTRKNLAGQALELATQLYDEASNPTDHETKN